MLSAVSPVPPVSLHGAQLHGAPVPDDISGQVRLMTPHMARDLLRDRPTSRPINRLPRRIGEILYGGAV